MEGYRKYKKKYIDLKKKLSGGNNFEMKGVVIALFNGKPPASTGYVHLYHNTFFTDGNGSCVVFDVICNNKVITATTRNEFDVEKKDGNIVKKKLVLMVNNENLCLKRRSCLESGKYALPKLLGEYNVKGVDSSYKTLYCQFDDDCSGTDGKIVEQELIETVKQLLTDEECDKLGNGTNKFSTFLADKGIFCDSSFMHNFNDNYFVANKIDLLKK